ncbi:MAG: ABC transporter substrate-binding protein [Halanaerobiales bacterium]
MRFKNINLFIILTILVGLFLTSTVIAQEEELIDPDIPESWYEAPKTASEIGITEFNQAPMLDERVENGEIPPVEERLPEDPPVIEPYEEIGKYGGRLNLWDVDLDGVEIDYFTYTGGARRGPRGEILPFFLKDWKFSDDYKDLTVYLREGVKYSDGEPLTADDIMYWWEHDANVKELQPVSPEDWKPALLDVTKEDEYSVTLHYGTSVPNRYIHLPTSLVSHWDSDVPSHYMKDFHPDFVGEEKVLEMAEDVGLSRWEEYYDRINEDSPNHPEYDFQRPVLRPYVAVERSETELILERNPYYPFVDTEGNQLPYIDEIRINLANSEEMAATKAATGEATFHARYTKITDIPLYKRNENKEDFTTLLYRRAYGAEVGLQFNPSTKDDQLRPIFQDLRFRKAISYAIDRENINNKVYFGDAVPRQATVLPTHELFKEEYAEAYAEYDPERAKELLDEMGMVDVDGDGYREDPDGEKFNPTLIYCQIGPVDPTNTLELVDNNLEDIGINIELQNVSRELHDTRAEANDFDISAWTFDQMAGQTMKTPYGLRFFAPVTQPTWNQWPGWTNWYTTDGEEGIEPPEEVKELIDLAETVIYTLDEEEQMEAMEKLIQSQAENIYMIGTVGMGPQAIIAKNKLKNIPKKGLWDAWLGYMEPMRTEQFYIDE